MNHKRKLVILGQPSGGTTLVAKILSCCSMYAGHSANRHMEDKRGLLIREQYWPWGDTVPKCNPTLLIPQMVEFLVQKVDWQYYKDPCAAYLLKHVGIPIQILRVTRPLSCSVQSMQRRWKWDKQRCEHIMTAIAEHNECVLRNNDPLHTVDYDALVDDPGPVISKLCDALGIHKAYLQLAIDIVDPSRRHFRE